MYVPKRSNNRVLFSYLLKLPLILPNFTLLKKCVKQRKTMQTRGGYREGKGVAGKEPLIKTKYYLGGINHAARTSRSVILI